MLNLFFESTSARHARRRRCRQYSNEIQVCEQRLLLSAVDVTTSPGPGGSVNVTFTGTDANDQVLLGTHYETGLLTAYSFNGTTFRLNGGPETDSLTFSSLSDVTFNLNGGSDGVSIFTTSLRDLNLNLGSGNDFAFIVDANIRDVAIQDGVDDFEQNSYTIQTFATSYHLRNIEAQFDRGSSQITVDAFTGKSIEIGKVSISGGNVQSVGFSANADSGSQVLITGKVQIQNDPSYFGVANVLLGTQQATPSEPGSVVLTKDLELNAPGGWMTISGNTSIHGKTDFVTTGFYNDRFVAESGAPVFEGKVTISTGFGDDYILLEKFDPSFPATEFHGKVSISTGEGNDIVNIGPAIFEGALTIDLGDSSPFGPFGADNMRLGAVDVQGKLDVTATGQAIVVISPPATGQAHFRKDASFTLGAGGVYINSSASNVTFDKAQVFVGQPNRIQVNYIGNVIANPAKRKLTNADLFTS
ncbi:hypothetical protein [Schlesneria sp. T3-172]|uniref:hypothetical protein n=1 Tax=Schlesneria sphaerica TaxID=3373610 RepID=UPI0037C852A8